MRRSGPFGIPRCPRRALPVEDLGQQVIEEAIVRPARHFLPHRFQRRFHVVLLQVRQHSRGGGTWLLGIQPLGCREIRVRLVDLSDLDVKNPPR
jgi:hypothetical protein